MATYFHGGSNNNNSGSEIQSSAEGLQTLYLLNPNYVPFSDSAHNPTQHNNILFLNPNNNNNSTSTSAPTHHPHALNLTGLSHAPPQHHLIGVTIPASNIIGSANNSEEISGGFHGFAMAAGAPRVHYNLWGSMDSINDRTPSSAAAAGVTVEATTSSNNSGYVGTVTSSAAAAEIGLYRPGSGLQQGLSLSLSSQHPSFRSFPGEMDVVSPASRGGNNNNNNGVSSIHSVVLGSKYLKVAQELLDEVVNVGNNKGISIIEGSSSNKEKMKGNIIVESSSVVGDGSSGGGGENNSGANNNKQGGELSTAQRQELQMKKSKLVNMLDEVEQKYREYNHEMQVVISSFEQGAGYGAARSYTCLALKTISKQFRCLKDAISSQIRGTSKAMGEDDASFLGGKAEGNSSSRLRFVDQHLRQQRALQQLGMIPHHHNAWRPQRGLPERAVSILRAWLFEHFLHPYPKDSDKVMLAKQTGLTRSQVSNWFINARVRLWKPMVEEMYLEEVKDHNNSITTSHDNNNNNIAQSKSEPFNNQNTTTTSPTDISNSNTIISSSISPNMGGGGGGHSGNFLLSPNTSSKPQQNSPSSILSSVDMDSSMNHSSNNNNNGEANNNNNNVIGGYGSSFSIEDIGRFNNHHHQQQLGPRFHGNGVSLTLGLPPSDHNNQHGGFLSHNNNMHLGGNNNNNSEFCAMNSTITTPHHPPSSHSGTSYDNIDMQNRKRFAAQLLRDFVA